MRRLIAIDATSVPAQPAGAGRYVLSLIHALARIDHEHDYVIYARRHSLDALAGLPDCFRIADVGDLSRARRYLWEQTSLPADLRRRGAVLLHSPHHTTPLLSPCPRVVTVHDATFFLMPERYPAIRRVYFQLSTLLSVRRARAIIVPSHSAAQDLRVVLHPPASRVHVTHEGVEACFQPLDRDACARLAREHYGLPEGYLLSLGTREPGKNRLALLQGMKQLVDAGRDLHLAVIGGEGWQFEAEDAAVEALGMHDRVHFTGYVPQDDLPALYNAARVFVFPSLHEGFGLPALEALACGTPVVTSGRSSLPEVVGEAALLVDPADPGAIATAITRVLDEPALEALLREAGPERAAAFTWDACAEKTLAVYQSLLRKA